MSMCGGGGWGRASGYELLFLDPGAGPLGQGGAFDGLSVGEEVLCLMAVAVAVAVGAGHRWPQGTVAWLV